MQNSFYSLSVYFNNIKSTKHTTNDLYDNKHSVILNTGVECSFLLTLNVKKTDDNGLKKGEKESTIELWMLSNALIVSHTRREAGIQCHGRHPSHPCDWIPASLPE